MIPKRLIPLGAYMKYICVASNVVTVSYYYMMSTVR